MGLVCTKGRSIGAFFMSSPGHTYGPLNAAGQLHDELGGLQPTYPSDWKFPRASRVISLTHTYLSIRELGNLLTILMRAGTDIRPNVP